MQTIQSPAQAQKISIEKLVQIPVEKVKEKLLHLGNEERIRYAGMLFEGNGWTVAYHRKGQQADSILLSYPKSPDNIVLMVRIDAGVDELGYEEVREHLLYFENELAPQYQCRQFCLIAFNGYESKAEHLEDFNLLLQKWSYVEELHLNYSSDKIREPRIQLFAHNKQTYKKVQRMMQTTNAVAVVQATGTGKSYLIAKLLQDFNGTKRLVMAPSTFIIEQIKEHIRWEVDKIQFMTYAKGMNLSESEIKALQPGLIVFDEFHRCGADEWGRGVQNIINAFPNAFKFGTSATPIRYLDNRRDMAKELFEGNIAENLSLAQAITRSILPMPKYVCALYTLKEEANNLRELIKRSRKNEEAKQKIMLELDTLSLDWERSNGIPQVLKKHLRKHMSKFIVFCENEKHLLETEPMVVGWFKEALRDAIPSRDGISPSIKTYRIYDGEPKSEQILEDFKKTKEKDTLHLLFSINMLNEGLHVNEVSGVVLLRPTASPNIFYQQIGRCLKVGMNHAPVIFDFVNNFKSVRTHDFMYDLQEAKRFFGEVRKEQDLKDLCPEFSIIDEVREITEVFGEIEFRVDDWEAMYERLVEFKKRFGHSDVPYNWEEDKYFSYWLKKQRKLHNEGLLDAEQVNRLEELGINWKTENFIGSLTDLWEQRFEEICEFRKLYGHMNPIKSEHDKKFAQLESFVKVQRKRYKAGTLQHYRVKKLEAIGFEWNPVGFLEGLWQQRFDELVAFKAKHGNMTVPESSGALSTWVGLQREAFRKNIIDPMRKQKLDSIGFDWHKGDLEMLFERRFSEMHAFKNEHGHLRFPRKSHLSKYRSSLRKRYNENNLAPEKIKRLEELGFSFDEGINSFEFRDKRLQQLEAFYDRYGHGNVPEGNSDFPGLGKWVLRQRQYYQDGSLDPAVIKRLEELKVDWHYGQNRIEQGWQKNYQELVSYYQEHGTSILKDGNIYKSLMDWCGDQREKYKKRKLSEEKIEKLQALGFQWDPFAEVWEQRYQELIAFKNKHGHCRVPYSKPGITPLSIWCAHLRKDYKKGILPEERKKRLEALGFTWDPLEEQWHTFYAELKAFISEKGWNALSRHKHKVGAWIVRVRREYHKGKLDEDKIMLLNQLGIEWSPLQQQWDNMYQQLVSYHRQYGNSHVTQDDEKHGKLGKWCQAQRNNLRKKILAPEQVKLLNNLGFIWVRDYSISSMRIWNERFAELLAYKEKFGKSDIHIQHKEYVRLYRWCKAQRDYYKQNKLMPEQLQRLNAIGFPWQPQHFEQQWMDSYQQLVNYKNKHGKGMVERTDAANKSLYEWCLTQRRMSREKKLSPDRLQLLTAIGFPFNSN